MRLCCLADTAHLHTPTFSPYLSSFHLYRPESRLRRFKLTCFSRAINAGVTQTLTWNYPQWEINSAHPNLSNSYKSPWQDFWRSGCNTTVLTRDTHLELMCFITHCPTVVGRMMTVRLMMEAWLVLARAANRKLFWKAILAYFQNEELEKMSQRACERRQRRYSYAEGFC